MHTRRIVLSLFVSLSTACGRGESRNQHGPEPPEQSPPLRTPEGLVLQARSWVVEGGTEPDTLHTRMTLRNAGGRMLGVEWGASCGFAVAVYRTPARTPPAVWAGPRASTCNIGGSSMDLAPGDSVAPTQLTFSKAVSKILGDSLPEGEYHRSGRYYLVAETLINDDMVSVPAGAVTLRRPGTPSDIRTGAD